MVDVLMAAELARYSYNENGFPKTLYGWVAVCPFRDGSGRMPLAKARANVLP
jgi:hypothetical protein